MYREVYYPHSARLDFGVIFIYPLFCKMIKSISKFKSVSKMFEISVLLYLFSIIGFVIILATARKIDDLNFENVKMFNGAFIYYFLSFISPFFLIYIRKGLNFYNESLAKQLQPEKKFSGEEIFIIIFGFFMNYGALLLPVSEFVN